MDWDRHDEGPRAGEIDLTGARDLVWLGKGALLTIAASVGALLLVLVMLGSLSANQTMAPVATPTPTTSSSTRPTPEPVTYAPVAPAPVTTTEDPGNVYVSPRYESDDDGESRFCRKRFWC